jgi:hypothetical protein
MVVHNGKTNDQKFNDEKYDNQKCGNWKLVIEVVATENMWLLEILATKNLTNESYGNQILVAIKRPFSHHMVYDDQNGSSFDRS